MVRAQPPATTSSRGPAILSGVPLVGLLVVWALIAAACGGGDDATATTAATAPAAVPTTTADLAAAPAQEVVSPDGTVTVRVPAGQLLEPVTVTPFPLDATGLDPAIEVIAAFDLGPDGASFDEPVGITIDTGIPHNAASLPAVVVLHGGPEGSEIPGSITTEAVGDTVRVSFIVDHFSSVVVLAMGSPLEIVPAEIDTYVNGTFSAVVQRSFDGSLMDSAWLSPIASGAVGFTGDFVGDPFLCEEAGSGSYGFNMSVPHYWVMGNDFPPNAGDDVAMGADYLPAALGLLILTWKATTDLTFTGTVEGTAECHGVIEVPVSCERITEGLPTPIPCEDDGVPMAGTGASIELAGDTLAVGCQPACGEPDDWPFHQYQIELWLDDDRAILCDDDPIFNNRLTNMQTFEVLSSAAQGVTLPERAIAEEGVGLQLTGPWTFNTETGVFEIGDAPIPRIVLHWWFGEEPVNSDISRLTVTIEFACDPAGVDCKVVPIGDDNVSIRINIRGAP